MAGQLTELLDQLEMYDFKAGQVDLNQSKVMGKLRAMAKEMDDVLATVTHADIRDPLVGASRLSAERASMDPQVEESVRIDLREQLKSSYTFRDANTMLSILYDVPGHKAPLVIGWTTCEKCMMHIRLCRCPEGPTEPHSVQQWREESGHVAPKKDLPPTVVDRFDRSAPAQPAEDSLPAQDSDLTASAVQDADTGGEGTDDVCKVCGIAVTTENADQNDDGTWTCFADQAQAAERS
jgi:hypothetical protein